MTDSTNVVFDDSLVDFSPPTDTGYPSDWAASDTPEALAGLGTREFPDHLWIEPKDWKDFARQNDEHGTWPESFRNRFTNQSPTHECTCHALTQNWEIAYNRQRQGAGKAVFVSPLSIYAEANPRKWGGSSMQYTLGIALERGFLPDHVGPNGTDQRQLFRHTMHGTTGRGNQNQSSGNWVRLSNFPSGWKNTARHLKPDEVVNPRSWEQIVCLILHGYCVSVGRSGHAIPYVQIVWRNGDLYAMYADSYDIHRYDSVRMIRAGVGGAYSIATTRVPSDWNNPAGVAF